VDGANGRHVLGRALEQGFAQAGAVGQDDQPAARQPGGDQIDHLPGQLRLGAVATGFGLGFLGGYPPQDVETEGAVFAGGQLDDQAESDPVGAEAED
jgi:hypothetical protein